MNRIKRTERGWGGHFILCDRCLFRRNTLLSDGENYIVVSTVGGLRRRDTQEMDTVGAGNRWYETMIFLGVQDGHYIEADPCREHTNFVLDGDWQICADEFKDLPPDVDTVANDMHERAVKKTRKRFYDIVSMKEGE